MKYYSAYKDEPYGKIKGDKKDFLFQTTFTEAKVTTIDEGYLIYGKLESLLAVMPAFGSALPEDLGYCEIPVYSKDYTIRQSTGKKDSDGKWIYAEQTFKPSGFEVQLANHIQNNPTHWMAAGKSLKGSIMFVPDIQHSPMVEAERQACLTHSVQMLLIEDSKTLPEYQVKTPQRKSYAPKGASLEEKVAFLKRDFAEYCNYTEEEAKTCSIALLVQQVIAASNKDSEFIAAYFSLLRGIIS